MTKNFSANWSAIRQLSDKEITDMFCQLFGFSCLNEEVQNYIEEMLKEMKS